MLEHKADYYKRQLLSYSLACRNLPLIGGLKPTVKQASLYFLDCGEHIDLSFNDKDEMNLISEIENASKLLFGNHNMEDYAQIISDNCPCAGIRVYAGCYKR